MVHDGHRKHDLIGDERTGRFENSTLDAEFVALADPVIESAWLRLQREGHVDSPFLTWQWYSAMRDCPELGTEVRVLACWSDREIVGLLPLERVLRDGLRVIGTAGWHWAGPDHADVIGPKPERLRIACAMLRALRRDHDWDLLDFDGIRADAALAAAMDIELRAPRFVHARSEQIPISYVELDGQIVSTHAAQKIRKEVRKAVASGGGFETITSPDRFPAVLEDLMDLHTARFGSRSRVFATPARRRFHHLAAQRLGAAGMARMHILRVGETVAAANYTLVWQDSLLVYSSGMRTDIAANAGFTVHAMSMMAAAGDGFAEADLLRGDHSYKKRFETVVRNDLRKQVVRVGHRTAAAAVARVGGALVGRIRRR